MCKKSSYKRTETLTSVRGSSLNKRLIRTAAPLTRELGERIEENWLLQKPAVIILKGIILTHYFS